MLEGVETPIYSFVSLFTARADCAIWYFNSSCPGKRKYLPHLDAPEDNPNCTISYFSNAESHCLSSISRKWKLHMMSRIVVFSTFI